MKLKIWSKAFSLLLTFVFFNSAYAVVYKDHSHHWEFSHSGGERCRYLIAWDENVPRSVTFKIRGKVVYSKCTDRDIYRYYQYVIQKAKDQNLDLVFDSSIEKEEDRLFTEGTPRETVKTISVSDSEILKTKIIHLEKRISELEARQKKMEAKRTAPKRKVKKYRKKRKYKKKKN